jgi:hypothetical protein
MNGESFVVRIYRREKKGALVRRSRVLLEGVVETAEGGRRGSFHGIDELWELLARAQEGRAKRRK